jgi:hypothetical protein
MGNCAVVRKFEVNEGCVCHKTVLASRLLVRKKQNWNSRLQLRLRFVAKLFSVK